MIRIGQSRDTHRFKPGKGFMLGGVFIPALHTTVAHSDGDCLFHAIGEAMLGALALGDLGTHFSDRDPTHQGRDSADIVKEIHQMVQAQGYAIGNIDATVHLEVPKLMPYIDTIRSTIAEVLDVSTDRVSVKATTGEGVGIVGRQEALVCEAVVLMIKRGETND